MSQPMMGGKAARRGAARTSDWVLPARDASGPERLEAFFTGRGYDLHRHDTYGIGRTLSGVQRFQYRGGWRTSLPGGTVVLHPDELHDGQAGSDTGFRYRIVYIEPAAIQAVLGGRPLPFVRDAVSRDARLFQAAGSLLDDLDRPLEALECDDAVYDLARALEAAAGAGARPKVADYRSAERARAYLQTLPSNTVTLAELERVSGRDRFGLSRDFRALFGTSPYRYLVLRRLDAVKAALGRNIPAAEAAINAGFADQAHMTRHFTRAFGMPPARWQRMLKAQ